MKKIMIFAVAALTLAACSKTFDNNKVASEGNAIGFGTWTETLTKAVADPTNPRVQGTSYFRTGDGIVVYGSKTDTDPDPDVTSVVFNGIDVVATAEGGDPTAATAWDYNNHRFWDTNAESYTFFAVSPKEKLATTTTTATDGAFVTSVMSKSGSLHLRQGVPTGDFLSDQERVEHLPFLIRLDTFLIRCYPGTETPQDYISHITCQDQQYVTGDI